MLFFIIDGKQQFKWQLNNIKPVWPLFFLNENMWNNIFFVDEWLKKKKKISI